jgi:hypothetical protein
VSHAAAARVPARSRTSAVQKSHLMSFGANMSGAAPKGPGGEVVWVIPL